MTRRQWILKALLAMGLAPSVLAGKDSLQLSAIYAEQNSGSTSPDDESTESSQSESVATGGWGECYTFWHRQTPEGRAAMRADLDRRYAAACHEVTLERQERRRARQAARRAARAL